MIAGLIQRACSAQTRVADWSQARIDRAVASLGWHVLAPDTADRLARAAVRETGIGNAHDSLLRLQSRVRGVMCDLHGVVTIGPIEQDHARNISRYVKPVGVVGVLVPSTAPIAAMAMNALMAIKTRNAVVFCPNPAVAASAVVATQVMRAALAAADAPADLIQCVENPDRDTATRLAQGADLVIATGGAATVRRAMSAGRPTFAAGPGNVVVIVDHTADPDTAARLIARGKGFDNGTSCSSESNLLIDKRIWNAMQPALARHGIWLCDDAEALRRTVWPGGKLSRAVVGRPATVIADMAGLTAPQGTRAIALPLRPGTDDPLAGEKLCPLLGFSQFDTLTCAISRMRELLAVAGIGHSCAVHSQSESMIDAVARAAPVSRIMINQSSAGGNTGSFDNGMPFTSTVSCGTWGGSTISENVGWRQFLNFSWVSRPMTRTVPDWDELVAPWLTARHQPVPALDCETIP